MVDAAWRTWAFVTVIPGAVFPFRTRSAIFHNIATGRDIPYEPVIESAVKCVRIIHDQYKAFGFLRNILNAYRRIDIFPVTGIF
jgi:hypothetical protein